MPWTAKDARSHTKKADTKKKQRQWAKAANSALKQYDGDEGRAIRVANAPELGHFDRLIAFPRGDVVD